jgi:short-subunit dehydrogenase
MTVSFSTKYGPWALVTGASRGLGAEFARQSAERGLNTVLVATNAELLKAQADSIKKDYGVEIRTVTLDLSREDFLPEITAVTDSLEIGLLVNNAGVSKVKPFLKHNLDFLIKQLHVNARAGLILAHHFGKKMAERRRGGIIFLSSDKGLQPDNCRVSLVRVGTVRRRCARFYGRVD